MILDDVVVSTVVVAAAVAIVVGIRAGRRGTSLLQSFLLQRFFNSTSKNYFFKTIQSRTRKDDYFERLNENGRSQTKLCKRLSSVSNISKDANERYLIESG